MFIKVAPLWLHQSQKGTQFLTGRLDLQSLLQALTTLAQQDPTRPVRVAVFINDRRTGPGAPHCTLSVYGELPGKGDGAPVLLSRVPVKFH